MEIKKLSPAQIGERWAEVKPFLEGLAELSQGRQSVATYAKLLRDADLPGHAIIQAWVVEDEGRILAFLLTEMKDHPTGMRTGLVWQLAGKGRKEWRHLLAELHSYFREWNCSLVEVVGRIGWVKDALAAGYKRSAIIFECPLMSTETVENVLRPGPSELDVSRETSQQEAVH